MTLSAWVRQIHRWVSIIFAAIVAGIFLALALRQTPASWVYYLPLPFLFLLLLTGLYMFVLPYVAQRRADR